MGEHKTGQSPTATSDRVAGYDVARALALLGMVVVHFSLVAAADRSGPPWMTTVLGLLDGRAAMLFVILAGVGVTLLSRRAVAGGNPHEVAAVRKVLTRRGLFLLALGFVNLLVWPGDILRVYGVSLLVAAWLVTAPGRRLLWLAAGFVAAFVVLVLAADFERNWDWATLTYRNLWSPSGAVRNLFYDGFRSVLPWTGVLLFGMWLGRFDLRDPRLNTRVMLAAAGTALAAEVASRALVSLLLARPRPGLDRETVTALFGTESVPAFPLFLLSSGGAAVFVAAASVRLAYRWPGRGWRPLVAAGQMALTWYVAHIVLGLGALVALGVVGTEPLPVAAGLGLAFFGGAVLLSWGWTAVFRHGPLEWVMRTVAG
jgi:uncharacterized membrane protein YeiB